MPGTVIIGMIGNTLDKGLGPDRWHHWRPTVDIARQEGLVVDRFELLHQSAHARLAKVVAGDIRSVSPETEVRLHPVNIPNPWDFEQVYTALRDFADGYAFNPERERYLVHITTGTHVIQICWYLLTEARFIPGQLLQAQPGRRDQPGPVAIIDLDLSKYDALAARFARERREDLSFLKSGIDTQNAAFNRLIERIESVAIRSDAPMLLTGPTGAGKSQLAGRIFELKQQRRQVSGAFVEVNCATLRGDAAMSALFGHVKGAFTGAQRDREGHLRAAHGGLLFLDEIGELGPDEQAMLLRALEEKRFFPLGSDREVESHFQLIAGTNRNLGRAVREGRFRDDLLARINLWSFELPPLRARPEDIEPNLDYELHEATMALGHKVTMSKEARQAFLRFARSPQATWPGNFRDFNAAITRLSTLAQGGRITVDDVREEIARLREAWAGGEVREEGDGDRALVQRYIGAAALQEIDPFDVPQLAGVIRVCESAKSLSEAGRRLFAVSRTQRKSTNDADRLRKYLGRFGLSWQDFR